MEKFTFFVIFAIVFANGVDINLNKQWEQYKERFHKSYSEIDEIYRRMVWEDNVNFIVLHNLDADAGLHTFTTGINEYSDRTNKEFISEMNGYRPPSDETLREMGSLDVKHCDSINSINETVDWRKLGYVTPVKNQGRCGSCWAFCSTGALEALHKKKTGKLVSLSEQNLMDCANTEFDFSSENLGCNGGLPLNAFLYVIQNHGIDTEKSYPYQAQNEVCRFKRAGVGATCIGYNSVASRNENDMKVAVATVGPIAVGINANERAFGAYRSGVFSYPQCDDSMIDHCVLIVGYGVEKGVDYWLVKNSWGPTWGEEGYIKMIRNKNICGIACCAIYPT